MYPNQYFITYHLYPKIYWKGKIQIFKCSSIYWVCNGYYQKPEYKNKEVYKQIPF